MARGGVTVRDLGWKKIKVAAKQLDGAGVKVGIRARDAGKQNDGVDVIDVAVWNEWGVRDQDGSVRTPARPFMRHTADTSDAAVRAVTARWAGMLLAGRMTVAQVLGSLGLWYADRIKDTVRNSRSWAEPNAASTVARKGSSVPLVDQGVLLGTIDWEHNDKR